MTPPLRNEQRKAILERDQYTCQDCGHHGQPGQGEDDLQVHHIMPRAYGGTNDPDNLMTLCSACHVARDNLAQTRGRIADETPIVFSLTLVTRRNLAKLAESMGDTQLNTLERCINNAYRGWSTLRQDDHVYAQLSALKFQLEQRGRELEAAKKYIEKLKRKVERLQQPTVEEVQP